MKKLFARGATLLLAVLFAATPCMTTTATSTNHHIPDAVAKMYGLNNLKKDIYGNGMRRTVNCIFFPLFTLALASTKSPDPDAEVHPSVIFAGLWGIARLSIWLWARRYQTPQKLRNLLESEYLKLRQDLVTEGTISPKMALERKHLQSVMLELADRPETTHSQRRSLLQFATKIILKSDAAKRLKHLTEPSEPFAQLFDHTKPATHKDITQMISDETAKRIKTIANAVIFFAFLYAVYTRENVDSSIPLLFPFVYWVTAFLKKFYLGRSTSAIYSRLRAQEDELLDRRIRCNLPLNESNIAQLEELATLYERFCNHSQSSPDTVKKLKSRYARIYAVIKVFEQLASISATSEEEVNALKMKGLSMLAAIITASDDPFYHHSRITLNWFSSLKRISFGFHPPEFEQQTTALN
jgi:hypothetical protein